ncbi:hypothetical protein [Rhizobium halophytocola]|uniref:Uncharacterized protein n=1 Tax=Rhizobium halophytocola TaxID=735519 RepID=A0ABS4DZP8_9HYPH|nr:hypothetical protein [Rhizobium halophytocola]MBP1851160.1 hypothetical protein [Rhizobium halophytocola]
MNDLKIYCLKPKAAPDDPRWDNSPPQGELFVRALSTGDARIVAEEAENDFPATNGKPAEGVSTANASAFRDDKLYSVLLDESGRFDSEGPRSVIYGHVDRNVLKTDPLHHS